MSTAGKAKGKKRTLEEAGLSAQDAEIEEMREWNEVPTLVAQLCEALQGRELSIKGRKPEAELVARLELELAIQGREGSTTTSTQQLGRWQQQLGIGMRHDQ